MLFYLYEEQQNYKTEMSCEKLIICKLASNIIAFKIQKHNDTFYF